MKITLTRPINYKDTEITEINLDLDSLTGNDLILAEENMRRVYPEATVFSHRHLLFIAAQACHIPAETLKTMSAKDYMILTTETMSFFVGADSENVLPEITDD